MTACATKWVAISALLLAGSAGATCVQMPERFMVFDNVASRPLSVEWTRPQVCCWAGGRGGCHDDPRASPGCAELQSFGPDDAPHPEPCLPFSWVATDGGPALLQAGRLLAPGGWSVAGHRFVITDDGPNATVTRLTSAQVYPFGTPGAVATASNGASVAVGWQEPGRVRVALSEPHQPPQLLFLEHRSPGAISLSPLGHEWLLADGNRLSAVHRDGGVSTSVLVSGSVESLAPAGDGALALVRSGDGGLSVFQVGGDGGLLPRGGPRLPVANGELVAVDGGTLLISKSATSQSVEVLSLQKGGAFVRRGAAGQWVLVAPHVTRSGDGVVLYDQNHALRLGADGLPLGGYDAPGTDGLRAGAFEVTSAGWPDAVFVREASGPRALAGSGQPFFALATGPRELAVGWWSLRGLFFDRVEVPPAEPRGVPDAGAVTRTPCTPAHAICANGKGCLRVSCGGPLQRPLVAASQTQLWLAFTQAPASPAEPRWLDVAKVQLDGGEPVALDPPFEAGPFYGDVATFAAGVAALDEPRGVRVVGPADGGLSTLGQWPGAHLPKLAVGPKGKVLVLVEQDLESIDAHLLGSPRTEHLFTAPVDEVWVAPMAAGFVALARRDHEVVSRFIGLDGKAAAPVKLEPSNGEAGLFEGTPLTRGFYPLDGGSLQQQTFDSRGKASKPAPLGHALGHPVELEGVRYEAWPIGDGTALELRRD
ncbi:MAG: hypothetical protein QM723_10890 [Myxococcaceae bacterium]